jgi:hypothetical protein
MLNLVVESHIRLRYVWIFSESGECIIVLLINCVCYYTAQRAESSQYASPDIGGIKTPTGCCESTAATILTSRTAVTLNPTLESRIPSSALPFSSGDRIVLMNIYACSGNRPVV